jgi:hypothetical protein
VFIPSLCACGVSQGEFPFPFCLHPHWGLSPYSLPFCLAFYVRTLSFIDLRFNINEFPLFFVYCLFLPSLAFPYHQALPTVTKTKSQGFVLILWKHRKVLGV